MHDFSDIVILMRKAALEAMNASKPMSVIYGKVISASPLKINVEQKLTLTSAQLVLTRNVTDYEVEMTVDHLTEDRSGGSGEASFASHNHEYKGKKKFKVHNGLVVGDEVIMLQVPGGQKFIVFDKLVKS
ncbi:hypothetical protein FHR92_003952 [Fontibacillus solani]|uniref:DUF2577 domain-containing protein n=1 Tax=Fontibacillus solani TaxID=1572857 RepID=A0A7W3XT75_9BACL|nr:DUF2577 domain-containing protein [Fontibacillus solani]MBA9087467.1 hypothetical protein [Fontibacillus solani]